jgi:uncharacterized protein YbjT (DUF2867 family)
MILVTGGTGFVGQALIRRLDAMGLQVRTLLRPAQESPNLPRGIPVEAVICGLRDERGLRAAMKGVEVIFHLAGSERKGSQADLMGVDIEGTRTVAAIAAAAGVDRIFFLSHLGADRASAYPLLKSKAIAENFITHSQIHHTIFRTAVLYGPGDQLTSEMVRMMRQTPVFILPEQGKTHLQPLWIEDLVTCLTLSLDDPSTIDQTLSVGGPEFLSFRQVCKTIMSAAGIHRWMASLSPAYLRYLTVYYEGIFKKSPLSVFWLDYLAADRTCDLDTIPRWFGLMPERFERRLGFLSPANDRAKSVQSNMIR